MDMTCSTLSTHPQQEEEWEQGLQTSWWSPGREMKKISNGQNNDTKSVTQITKIMF